MLWTLAVASVPSFSIDIYELGRLLSLSLCELSLEGGAGRQEREEGWERMETKSHNARAEENVRESKRKDS